MERIEAAVIGAGVIGLAVARALARAGRSVIILESGDRFGAVTSSRNSEVIHAGLHYPHGSRKERFCIEGKRQIYDYCASRHVPHRRCGKLTFAADPSERARLEAIAAHANAAGADPELTWLEARDLATIEPALDCTAALLSPSTGIIDSHAYMLSLLGEAEDHGAVLACRSHVDRIERVGDGWRLHVGDARLGSAVVVNAAGLAAPGLASGIEALGRAHVPLLRLAKGNYFHYAGKVPFTHLIYPLPVESGLGMHLTLDMAGLARFGPDVEWVEAIDYAVDPRRHAAFLGAARRIWPDLDPARLVPGYSGIRPKLFEPDGRPLDDFLIQGEATHGLPGLINLFGIESPGLTASLAIADHVLAIASRNDRTL